MTRAEILAKLEDIAQNGGGIAAKDACRLLLAEPEYAFNASEGAADPFAGVDSGDELGERRARVA